MPTLVAALTLAALLRIAYLELPRWHLAIWFAAVVALALRGSGLGWRDVALNGAGSFAAAWLYFAALEKTDNYEDRPLHYLILVAGLLALVGTRFWIDVRRYAIAI